MKSRLEIDGSILGLVFAGPTGRRGDPERPTCELQTNAEASVHVKHRQNSSTLAGFFAYLTRRNKVLFSFRLIFVLLLSFQLLAIFFSRSGGKWELGLGKVWPAVGISAARRCLDAIVIIIHILCWRDLFTFWECWQINNFICMWSSIVTV